MQDGVMIGIPTYNGWRRVRNLLLNLKQRTELDIPHQIVVCDDSGKPEHRQRVKEICAEFGATYIENQKNSGVAASWNSLVRSTDHEMAILLNDDVLVAKGWLRPIVYAVMENPRAGSVSMNCLFITESDVEKIVSGPDAQAVPLNVRYENGTLIRNERFREMPRQEDHQPGRVMCPAGCAFGFRRQVHDQVGGFDQRYFAFYEETDFGVACAWRGMPAFTLPYPHDNYHIWSATFGSAPEIPAGEIMNQSRNKFVAKWSAILGKSFQDAPEIHNLLMDKIEKFPFRWIGVGGKREETL